MLLSTRTSKGGGAVSLWSIEIETESVSAIATIRAMMKPGFRLRLPILK